MTETATPGSLQPLRLPAHGCRLVAFMIDAAAPLAVLVATLVLQRLADLGDGYTVAILVLAAVLLGTTNGIITWLSGGATVGKAWAGLQVRRFDHRTIAPALGDLPGVLARHTVGYFLIDGLLLGCLNALRDARRRPLHDYVLRYEVVALTDVPKTTEGRLRRFSDDLAAGQALIREQWKPLGTIVAAYVGVISLVGQGIVWAGRRVGLWTPTPTATETGAAAASSVSVPPVAVAVAVTAGGTALSTGAIVLSIALVSTDAKGYPDRIEMLAAVQFEDSAYPLGVPSAVDLELERGERLTSDELEDLGVLTSGDRATATLTFTEGELEGRTFTFEDVVVPVEWRIQDLSDTDVVSWSALEVSAADDGSFVPEGMPVADIRQVGGETYAGYRVASPGELSLSFPYRGDGLGGVDDVGATLTWEGEMECVVFDDDPVEGFDAAEECEDKHDDMFWVWGANSVTFD